MAILADALEDAGFAEEAILSHLRLVGDARAGVLGVDLILGKE